MSTLVQVAALRRRLPWILTSIVLGTSLPAVAVDPILIYSDRSAGTHVLEWGISQIGLEGPGVEVKRNVDDFIIALNEDAGSEVWVLARYTATPPSYIDALRAFATRTKRPVNLYLWDDNSAVFPPTADVDATAAFACWYTKPHAFTTISFMNTPDLDRRATVENALSWPNFAKVPIRTPEVIDGGVWNVANDPDQLAVAQDARRDRAYASFRRSLDTCGTDRDTGKTECDAIYENNPNGQTGCIELVSDDYKNCVAKAKNTLSRALRGCPSSDSGSRPGMGG